MKKIIILLLLLCTISCSTKKTFKVNETENANQFFRNSAFFQDIIANEHGLYYIYKGQLFFYDLEIQDHLNLGFMSYADDLGFDVYAKDIESTPTFKKYCDTFEEGPGIVFYDDHLYYASTYRNIENESNIQLNRLDSSGLNRETVFVLSQDYFIQSFFIDRGFLYIHQTIFDGYHSELVQIELSTMKEQIIATSEYPFDSIFLYKNGLIYSDFDQSFSIESSKISYYDFESKETEIIDTGVWLSFAHKDVYATNTLSDDANTSSSFLNEEGKDKIVIEGELIDFVDDNYIYTSTLADSKIYRIYDKDRLLLKEIEDSSYQSTNEMSVHIRTIGVFKESIIIESYFDGRQSKFELCSILSNDPCYPIFSPEEEILEE